MRALTTLTGAVLVAVLLGGCLPHTQREAPEPHPTPTPVFASEEQALAAAEDAYAAYLRVSEQVLGEGGERPERLVAVASGQLLEDALAGAESFRQGGLRSTGTSAFTDVSLQQFDPDAAAGTVVVYLCDDVSGVQVLRADGSSAVSNDRSDRTRLQITFDLSADQLLVSGVEVWGDGRC